MADTRNGRALARRATREAYLIFILSLGWRMAFLTLLSRRRLRAADMCRCRVDCSSESPQETCFKRK